MSTSTLLVVTGASRGLGRAFATSFVRGCGGPLRGGNGDDDPPHRLRAILLARSPAGLADTESLLRKEAHGRRVSLRVERHVVDMSRLDGLEETLDRILSGASDDMDDDDDSELPCRRRYDRAILVNNAGTLGTLGTVVALPSLRALQRDVDLNVTAALWLSARFAATFDDDDVVTERTTVVNVSSLCAVQPFSTLGSYGAGKAARDLFHATLAAEHPGSSLLRVLNYAPGACDTDMQAAMRNSDDLDADLRQHFTKSQAAGDLVRPDDTADRLTELVLTGNFVSGAHVDYWDPVVVPPANTAP